MFKRLCFVFLLVSTLTACGTETLIEPEFESSQQKISIEVEAEGHIHHIDVQAPSEVSLTHLDILATKLLEVQSVDLNGVPLALEVTTPSGEGIVRPTIDLPQEAIICIQVSLDDTICGRLRQSDSLTREAHGSAHNETQPEPSAAPTLDEWVQLN